MSTYTIPLSNPVGTAIFVDTSSTNTAAVISGSAGTVYTIDVDNRNNSGAVYVKLWNTAAASVTVGVTDPVIQVRCPALTRMSFTYGPNGVAFSTAISSATTTDAGTAGTAAPTNSVILRVQI